MNVNRQLLIQKLVKTMKEVPEIYREILNKNSLVGNLEAQNITSKDHQNYQLWLLNGDPNRYPFESLKTLEIGANKVWGTINEIASRVSKNLEGFFSVPQVAEIIEFVAGENHDEVSYRINHPLDRSPDSFSRLYIQKPFETPLHLKVSVNTQFEGIFSLTPHGHIGLSDYSPSVTKFIESFKSFDKAVSKGELSYRLAFPSGINLKKYLNKLV